MNDMILSSAAMNVVPQQTGAMAKAQSAKAISTMQSMMLYAMKNPRDVNLCYTNVMKELERFSLAKTAVFSIPRKGGPIEGGSIKLALMIARNFKNLYWGTNIINRTDTYAECESFCIDLEACNWKTSAFTVNLVRDTKEHGKVPITDEQEVQKLISNFMSRNERKCIFAMTPADIIEDAQMKAKSVIKAGEGTVTFGEKVRNMLMSFADIHVTKEMIEKRLKHPVEQMNGEELVEMFSIYNSLKGKESRREEYFDFITDQATTPQDITNAAIKEKEANDVAEMRKQVNTRIDELLNREGRTPEAIAGLEDHIQMKIEQVGKLPANALLSLWNVLQKL